MPISILAVDDERNLLELLITVLGKRGLKMGPLNGVQLLKQIKDRQPVVKVIMMTAYPTSDTRMQASANGASAYLTKPVDLQKLVDTINSLAH